MSAFASLRAARRQSFMAWSHVRARCGKFDCRIASSEGHACSFDQRELTPSADDDDDNGTSIIAKACIWVEV